MEWKPDHSSKWIRGQSGVLNKRKKQGRRWWRQTYKMNDERKERFYPKLPLSRTRKQPMANVLHPFNSLFWHVEGHSAIFYTRAQIASTTCLYPSRQSGFQQYGHEPCQKQVGRILFFLLFSGFVFNKSVFILEGFFHFCMHFSLI